MLAVALVLIYANGLHIQARCAAPSQKNDHRVQSLFRCSLEDFIRAFWRTSLFQLSLRVEAWSDTAGIAPGRTHLNLEYFKQVIIVPTGI
jgi:hypothetical protein